MISDLCHNVYSRTVKREFVVRIMADDCSVDACVPFRSVGAVADDNTVNGNITAIIEILVMKMMNLLKVSLKHSTPKLLNETKSKTRIIYFFPKPQIIFNLGTIQAVTFFKMF